jgi:diacylglycerol kinase (ATP)
MDAGELERLVAASELIVVAGGDGTIHHTLPVAMRTGVPVYQLPMGTENLFARQFSMEAKAELLARSLVAPQVVAVDTASCNARPFVLMCSVGFDANIVERVATNRNGPITRLNYIGHGLKEIVAPRIPTLSILVDGQPIVGTQPGMVVVANSRQYAARLDPAPEANMTDGVLDVVFFPGSSRIELGLWGVRTMLRTHTSAPDLVTARGQKIVIHAESPTPFQLDGEHAGHLHPQTTDHRELTITVNPGMLKVLLPSG